MAMTKAMAISRAKIKEEVTEAVGDLHLKRALIRRRVNSAQSASFFTTTGSYDPGSIYPTASLELDGFYYQNSGITLGCCPPDDDGHDWGMVLITGSAESGTPSTPIPVSGGIGTVGSLPMVYPCPQTVIGAVRIFTYSWEEQAQHFINLGSGPITMGHRVFFDGFPQYCTPRAVSVHVLQDFTGNGDGEELGNVWIDRVGIYMQEQGEGATGAPIESWHDPTWNQYSGAPVACGGSMPKVYSDRTYFYDSSSMANCCIPPLSGAQSYAIYGANQGGVGIFTPPRFGNGNSSWDSTLPESAASTTAIWACLDRENAIYNPTASFIQMTQHPINRVRIALNKQLHASSGSLCTGRIRVCCYYDQIVGGYETSQDFLDSTVYTSSSFASYNNGIYKNCVSGTIIP